MKVAIIGCAHGELVDLYQAVEETERQIKSGEPKISLVLCCGDFQSCRTYEDLQTMACPPKYRQMNSFFEYYSGKRVAPVLTIFVGGNHEASNHLQELPYGGWVAPNMYFLGYAGCIRVNDELVIGGLSGIFNPGHYSFGRFERVPYTESMLRSVFHVKRHDVRRLELLAKVKQSKPRSRASIVDVFLSHDWPDHVACSSTRNEPNVVQLLKRKPFFQAEVERNDLGSPANRVLMDTLMPMFWFAAHMHVKFGALVGHYSSESAAAAPEVKEKDPDEIDLDDDAEEHSHSNNREDDHKRSRRSDDEDVRNEDQQCDASSSKVTKTKFLALDKIVKGRDFMQVLEIPMVNVVDGNRPPQLFYDKDWLAVIKATHSLTPLERNPSSSVSELLTADLIAAQQFIEQKFGDRAVEVPMNFVRTVDVTNDSPRAPPPRRAKGNPQTDEFLTMLELNHLNPLTVPFISSASATSSSLPT